MSDAESSQPRVRAAFAPFPRSGTALALAMTVLGWSAMWAYALAGFDAVTVAAAAAVFLLGLALIPLVRHKDCRAGRPVSAAKPPLRVPAFPGRP